MHVYRQSGKDSGSQTKIPGVFRDHSAIFPGHSGNDIDLFGIVVAILFCMQKCGARICRGEIPLKSMQNYATFKKK